MDFVNYDFRYCVVIVLRLLYDFRYCVVRPYCVRLWFMRSAHSLLLKLLCCVFCVLAVLLI